MNQIEGKVIEYNGNTGIIRDIQNNEYLILKNNINQSENISINDDVMFVPEIFSTIDIEEKIATFIQKKK